MSNREELMADIRGIDGPALLGGDVLADGLIVAGYRKTRTITTLEELEALPVGSAVQTSDTSDTVVLKGSDGFFRNQDGYPLAARALARWGTQPFTVIYEAAR